MARRKPDMNVVNATPRSVCTWGSETRALSWGTASPGRDSGWKIPAGRRLPASVALHLHSEAYKGGG